MSEMSTRDVIAGALEILADEKSWAKGFEECQTLDSGSSSVRVQSCLWGAFKRAITPGYYRGYSLDEEELRQVSKLACDAAEMVGKIIREQYPDRISISSVLYHENQDAIIPFNDHLKTVHSEVIAVLEKTLANL